MKQKKEREGFRQIRQKKKKMEMPSVLHINRKLGVFIVLKAEKFKKCFDKVLKTLFRLS